MVCQLKILDCSLSQQGHLVNEEEMKSWDVWEGAVAARDWDCHVYAQEGQCQSSLKWLLKWVLVVEVVSIHPYLAVILMVLWNLVKVVKESTKNQGLVIQEANCEQTFDSIAQENCIQQILNELRKDLPCDISPYIASKTCSNELRQFNSKL